MPPTSRKRKSSARPSPLRRLISLVRGPAGPFLLAALLVAVLSGAGHLVWGRVRDRVLSSDDYLVTPEQIEITPPPEWIHSDIRSDVFRNASLDGPLSILDEKLTERVHNAAALNPWVADVRVWKRAGGRVELEMVYRRPVCMVLVPGDDLLPIDQFGVLLPHGKDDFSSVDKSRYPRLVGIDAPPTGPVGECWANGRVVGGAEIAAVLLDVWEDLDLRAIVPSTPSHAPVTEEPTYSLLTRSGTHIFWGRAPGTHTPGELPSAEKIARLQDYVRRHGTLDPVDGSQQLDIYGLRVSARPNRESPAGTTED